ncbi:MAG: sugar porter family MFS transporter [Balneolaceae bacterium]
METKQPNQPTESVGRVVFLSSVAAIGGFLFGFDSGVINGTVDALQQAFDSDAVGTGFNVASMLLGCATGAFFAGSMADKFGRRTVMIATAIAFVISAWGSGIASSSESFVLFRILGGLAVGGASIIAPAYISEIAPPSIRGRLTSLQQLMIVIGLFCAFLSNYLIAGSAGGATLEHWGGFGAWQWMFWAEMIPATIYFLALLFIPESPRYLVAAGRADEAESVLASIMPFEKAKELVARIRETVLESRKPTLSDIFVKESRRVHPIIWVGVALSVLQQFTGINVVFYYGAVLWQSAGFTESDALLTNVINGSVNIAFTFVAIALIDRVGRKPLLLIGALGQAVMLGLLAIIFATGDLTPAGDLQLNETQGLWALLAANAYIAFFACTWGPIVWVLLGEMFPNRFRGAALAVCGLLHWLANFSITLSFPILLASIGLGPAYGIYAFFGLVAWFAVRTWVRETKGLTLEEMSGEL